MESHVNGLDRKESKLFINVTDQLWWFLAEIEKIPHTMACVEEKIYAVKAMIEFILLPQVKELMNRDSRFDIFKEEMCRKREEFCKSRYLWNDGGMCRNHRMKMFPDHGKLSHRFADTLAELECYLSSEGDMRRRSSRLKLEIINKYLDKTFDERQAEEENAESERPMKRVSVKVLPRRSARLMTRNAGKGAQA